LSIQNLWRIEDDQARLSFHPGQSRAWHSDKRFVFVIAGTQGGKTTYGPWWLWREIKRNGPGDYLAVTASFDLFKLKMLPEMKSVFCDVLDIGRWWAGQRVIEIKNFETNKFEAKRSDDPMWGRIILRSAQSKGGLESATAKAAWLDECGQDEFTLENWEAVQRRLSLHQGRVLGTTTPYNLGWLKSEIYDPWADGEVDYIDVINFSSTLNPAFPQEEYDRIKARMQDWRFQMFYDGILTRPAGLIYNCFTDDLLVDDFEVPASWPRALGVDFGGANTAILWAAENPDDGVWYLYDEWLGGGKTSEEYVGIAKDKIPDKSYCLAWGGSGSEGQSRRDWQSGGLDVMEPPVSDVEAGIDRGARLIKDDKLRVFRSLSGFRDEIGSYRRETDEAGEPTDKIANKRRFHRMDAYRYMAGGIVEDTGPWAVG